MRWLWAVVVLFPYCAHAQQTPAQTVRGLKTAPGLEVTLWAAEPNLFNPTNIDIDARGRVWVLEGVNYRRQLRGEKDYRANGDRILILEDTDGDGKADKVKVFDQNIALRSPLGIAVLGDKVIISQSPDVIVYTKDDQDHIVKKETLLTGWHGIDHDHGVHAVVFGHDGRYYFNSGDPGFEVTDKSGNRFVSSKAGPYYAGTVQRVNPDGTGFKVLAHNFRNPYELALDSFGNMWQTDNDDDGNAWVRVLYVMEGGNYGYWGPDGRAWREDKSTHFHHELPGVIPNIARTGAGAPCGLVAYEGTLLPERYRGQLLHAEAGKRLINTYFMTPDGSGYRMEKEDTISGPDTWFRPSDVAVGPDGAVYIADWYDPSVGGHQMKDIERGRIYRLAPAGYKARMPQVDLESPDGVAAALRSPAQSVRYLAYQKLKGQGAAALPVLLGMWRNGDRTAKARSLWLLGGIPGEGWRAMEEALHHGDPNFRILGMRVARLYGANIVEITKPLLSDPSPLVRREAAVLLQDVRGDAALDALVELCAGYDGADRWYLEALGIAARGRENALWTKLRNVYPGEWNSLLARFAWEFRPSRALDYVSSGLRNARLSEADRGEALEAVAASPSLEAARALAQFVSDPATSPALAERALAHLNHQLFSEWVPMRKDPAMVAALKASLQSGMLQARALEIVDDLEDPQYGPELLALFKSEGANEEVRAAALQALGRTKEAAYIPEIERALLKGAVPLRVAAVRALAYAKPEGIEARFRRLIQTQSPNEVRVAAVRVMGRTDLGAAMLLDLEQAQVLPPELRTVASSVTNSSRNPVIRKRAARLLPGVASKNKTPLPPLRVLLGKEGDPARGKRVFSMTTGPKCNSCHSLDGKRKVGPDLAAIGSKLGKDALFDAILNPSAGIAPEFYLWIVDTKTQGQVTGIIIEDTPQRLTLRTDTGDDVRLKPSEVAARRRSRLSMMPEDLVNSMTEQQLVDVVAYLETLKDDKRASVR